MSWLPSARFSSALVRTRRSAFAGVLVVGAVVSLPVLTATSASAATVCPAVGQATDCGVFITINSDGSFTVTEPGNGNPYDGTEDTLIGVVNNAAGPLDSLTLSGPDIFGFDGDGVCTYATGGASGGSGFAGDSYCSTNANGASSTDGTDPFDYSGPGNSFTVTDSDDGVVNFNTPVPPGGSAFFSLEGALDCTNTDVPCVTVPPGTLTIQKTDKAGKPLVGGTYSVFSDKSPHAGSAIGTCTITGLDTSGNATCTDTTLQDLKSGQYYVDETNPPAGYTAAAETPVLVFGNTTATIVDDPIPVTAPAAPTTTSTTTTTTAPAPVVANATVVHTGESFAGSGPYVVAALALGGSMLGLGLLRRRRHVRGPTA
jgi:Prealbumin-like fold domain